MTYPRPLKASVATWTGVRISTLFHGGTHKNGFSTASGAYTFTAGSPASVVTFAPNVPNGASIQWVQANIWSATGTPVSTTSASLGYVQNVGGISTDLVNVVKNLTGTITAMAPSTISTIAWTSGATPSTVPSVTVVLSANITSGYQALVTYELGYDV